MNKTYHRPNWNGFHGKSTGVKVPAGPFFAVSGLVKPRGKPLNKVNIPPKTIALTMMIVWWGGVAPAVNASNNWSSSSPITATTGTTVTGTNATALGGNATANGTNATALGGNAAASANGAVAIGGNGSGKGAKAASNDSIAMGTQSSVDAAATNGIAIGLGAKATLNGAVALGSNSITAPVVQTPNAIINGIFYNFAGTNPASTVSVGAFNAERTITNVAAGRLNPSSTDAVNGSQLNAIALAANQGWNVSTQSGGSPVAPGNTVKLQSADSNIAVTNSGTDVTFKLADQLNVADQVTVANRVSVGNTTVDTTGLKTTGGPSVTTTGIDAASKPITNLVDGVNPKDAVSMSQLNAVSSQLNAVSTAANKGWNVSTQGGGTSPVTPGNTVDLKSADSNIAVTNSGTDVTFKLADQLNVADQVTVANRVAVGNATVDTTGLKTTGGPSVTTTGIDAASKPITNLADGVNPKDAVSMSQLNATNAAVDALGTTVSTNTTNITNLTDSVTNRTIGPVQESGTANQLALVASGGTGSTPGTQQTLTNVADGVNPKDAVNMSQLNAVSSQLNAVSTAANAGWNVSTQSGGESTVAPGNTVKLQSADRNIEVTNSGTNVTFKLADQLNVADQVTVGDTMIGTTGLKITGGPSVTTSGIDAASKTITNVATGDISATSTDAVNGSQLNAVFTAVNQGWNVSTQSGGTSPVTPGNTVELKGADRNIEVTNSGTDVTFKLADQLNVAELKITNNGPSVTTNGIDAASKTITNLADGLNPKDAVSMSQLNAVSSQLNAVSTAANAGWNVSTQSGGENTVAPGNTVKLQSADSNIAVTNSGTDVTFKLADQLNVAELKITNNGPSVTTNGIDAASKPITNVATGDISATSTDAVNGSQLFATNTTVSSLASQLTTMSQTIANLSTSTAGAHFVDVNDNDSTPGDNYTNNGATGDDSIAVGVGASATGDGSISIGTGNKVSGNNSGAIGDPSTITGAGSYSLGNDNNIDSNNTFVVGNNVTIAAGNDDAVALGNDAGVLVPNGVALGSGAKATRPGMNGKKELYSNVSVPSTQGAVSVGSEGSERQITNVAGGTAPTDAVNVRQLASAQQNAVASSNAYTDARVNSLGREMRKDVSAGTAVAVAIGNLPQAPAPGDKMISLGTGFYKGQSALAIGTSYRSNNGERIYKASLTADTRGNVSVGGGVGFRW